MWKSLKTTVPWADKQSGRRMPISKVFTRYFLLILAANLGLFIPPLRLVSALFLLCFLPGYLFVERLSLFQEPLFAAVGSVGFSLLLAPFITLPGCLLLGWIDLWMVLGSLDLFLLGLAGSFWKSQPRVYSRTPSSPLLAPILVLICGGIFIYLDHTRFGPYSEDWVYLFGIIKACARGLPPQDPEASFLLLKYPWIPYYFYALVHRLGDISPWKVLEILSVVQCFVFLGLAYMLVFLVTGNRNAGLWTVVFLAVGKQSQWILRGLQGQGWHPSWDANPGWAELHAFSGYKVIWGWYYLPNMIPILMTLFFFIRYQKEGQGRDFWLSLMAGSISSYIQLIISVY